MVSSKAFAWKCSYPKNAFSLLYIWLPLPTNGGCTHTNKVEDWTLEVWFHDIKLLPILQAGKHPLKIISIEYQWDSKSLISLNSGMNCKHELSIWLPPSQVLEPNREFTKCTLNPRQACTLLPSGILVKKTRKGQPIGHKPRVGLCQHCSQQAFSFPLLLLYLKKIYVQNYCLSPHFPWSPINWVIRVQL